MVFFFPDPTVKIESELNMTLPSDLPHYVILCARAQCASVFGKETIA